MAASVFVGRNDSSMPGSNPPDERLASRLFEGHHRALGKKWKHGMGRIADECGVVVGPLVSGRIS